MSKQSLLLVDGDTRSLRVLEVSLRKAGFSVTPAASVQDALDKLELHAPDLIISETTFTDGDGFELRRRVRGTPDWAEIPFIFLTAEAAIENKIRGLELGVDDYLTKPIYIKEIVTRINILLQKRQRVRFEERKDGRTRFAGRVADMPVVDVIQTIEISRKSGVIQFIGERGRQAAIYFRDGRVIDAEAGTLQGEDAVYRLLTWSDGEFEVVFRTVRRREVITTSSQGLLMEGMRRLDEWSRLLEQLPPLNHRFEIDTAELAQRLGDVPDDNNQILRLLDGKRTLLEVIDASDFGDLECLQAISRLYFEGLLTDLDHGQATKRDTGKPMPLVEMEDDEPEPADVGVDEADIVETKRDSDPTLPDHALMGSYRPSSLRLIDDAIAAAQAIDPSLFDDDPAIPQATSAADDASIPQEIPPESEHDRVPPRPRPVSIPPPVATPSIVRDEESGLRMIGSLGRDRAEASGELRPVSSPEKPRETQREMITIMPRRITREMAAVTPADVASAPTPPAAPVEPPAAPVIARKFTPTGSGVVAKQESPGRGLLALGLLGAALVAVLAFMLLSGDEKKPAAPPDAAAPAVVPDAALLVEDAARVEERTVDAAPPPPPDARIDARIDAKVDAAAPSDAVPDVEKQFAVARQLYEQAHGANQEGDFTRALDLADQSLRLRKTARAYIVRAQAQQRLGRLDEALASMDEALRAAPQFPGGHEALGNILWAAGRYAEAVPHYEQYLKIQPTGETAQKIRKRLAEPR